MSSGIRSASAPLIAPLPSANPQRGNIRGNHTFGSLDGLRCASIIAVIWHHTANDALQWLPGANRGFLGVDMFFVISGFLIVTLILRERRATGSISLRNFYCRRMLRIFPVYYGLLGILTLYFVFAPSSNQARAFLAELPYHATYTSNLIAATSMLAITWSLSTEEQFYLLWPPVEKYLGPLILPALGLVLIANQLVNFRLADPWLQQLFGVVHDELFILHSTFTPICLGVALAHLMHDEHGRAVAFRMLGGRAASAICLLVLLLLGNLPADDISGWQRLALQLSMTALVCSCVVREDHGLAQLLSWEPIRRIGAISYGMYLYHVVALYFAGTFLLRHDSTSPWIEFSLGLAFTVAIAELSYRFFEQPILGLKRHFR